MCVIQFFVFFYFLTYLFIYFSLFTLISASFLFYFLVSVFFLLCLYFAHRTFFAPTFFFRSLLLQFFFSLLFLSPLPYFTVLCCYTSFICSLSICLLSSSFQLFICLLLGCLFCLSNDKCILRANIGKNTITYIHCKYNVCGIHTHTQTRTYRRKNTTEKWHVVWVRWSCTHYCWTILCWIPWHF